VLCLVSKKCEGAASLGVHGEKYLSHISGSNQKIIKEFLKRVVDLELATIHYTELHETTPTNETNERTNERDAHVGSEKPTTEKLEKTYLLELYDEYPLKKGKKRGLVKLATMIRDHDQCLQFATAVDNYRAQLKKDRTDPKFIMHFDTFVNQWEEHLDPNHGTSDLGRKL